MVKKRGMIDRPAILVVNMSPYETNEWGDPLEAIEARGSTELAATTKPTGH